MLDILVGAISSGKSTYSREQAKKGAIILNDDALVVALHGDYRFYDKNLKPLYKSIENQIISSALTLRRDVIVDRPNHSRQMRRRYIGLAHSFDVLVRLVLFERQTPEIHAQRRFESDSRGHSYAYWLEVAQHHDRIFEYPSEDEGFDEILEWKFS